MPEIIHIKVKANSAEEKITQLDKHLYEVKVKAPAENNKANIVVIKLLSKYFNKEAKIMRGKTSKNKTIKLY